MRRYIREPSILRGMKFEPYESENLIFIDTEFSDLDPYKGEILSIGAVKLDGSEFYIELEYDGESSDWVTKHILPSLTGSKHSREDASTKLKEFMGDGNPFVIAFVDNYDVIYLTKLFGAGKLPFRWVSIDFASILFGMGINPVKFLPGEKGVANFYKKIGINFKKYRQHHALDDAKLLRDVWLKMTDKSKPTS